jgi:hypothetical protein
LFTSPDERIRESNDYVVWRTCEVPNPVGAARHNCCIAKYLNPHIVDLHAANPVHPSLKNISKDPGPISHPAIWPRASPFGRNDPLDHCPVAVHPGFRQNLLELCQNRFILF